MAELFLLINEYQSVLTLGLTDSAVPTSGSNPPESKVTRTDPSQGVPSRQRPRGLTGRNAGLLKV